MSLDGKVWIRRAAITTPRREKKKKKKRFEIRDAHNYARLLIAASRMQRRPPFFWHALVVSYLSIGVFIAFLAGTHRRLFVVVAKQSGILRRREKSQEKSRREFFCLLHIIAGFFFICLCLCRFIKIYFARSNEHSVTLFRNNYIIVYFAMYI